MGFAKAMAKSMFVVSVEGRVCEDADAFRLHTCERTRRSSNVLQVEVGRWELKDTFASRGNRGSCVQFDKRGNLAGKHFISLIAQTSAVDTGLTVLVLSLPKSLLGLVGLILLYVP
jgi:hypothetical protein